MNVKRRSPRFIAQLSETHSKVAFTAAELVDKNDVRAEREPKPLFDLDSSSLMAAVRKELESTKPLLRGGPLEVQVISARRPEEFTQISGRLYARTSKYELLAQPMYPYGYSFESVTLSKGGLTLYRGRGDLIPPGYRVTSSNHLVVSAICIRNSSASGGDLRIRRYNGMGGVSTNYVTWANMSHTVSIGETFRLKIIFRRGGQASIYINGGLTLTLGATTTASVDINYRTNSSTHRWYVRDLCIDRVPSTQSRDHTPHAIVGSQLEIQDPHISTDSNLVKPLRLSGFQPYVGKPWVVFEFIPDVPPDPRMTPLYVTMGSKRVALNVINPETLPADAPKPEASITINYDSISPQSLEALPYSVEVVRG